MQGSVFAMQPAKVVRHPVRNASQSESVAAVVLSVHCLIEHAPAVALVDQHFFPFATNLGQEVESP